MADSRRTQDLVAKLYQAFNDSGFLGMGGTDEEGLLAALKSARDQGLMRDVDALYNRTYPEELTLREELDDELSGDDFDQALALYEEGMKSPAPANAGEGSAVPKPPGPEHPANPVHATLAPMPEAFRVCLRNLRLQPLPFAKCRLLDFPERIYDADGDGIVTLPVPPGRKTMDIEWTEREAQDAEVLYFFMQQTVHVDFAGSDDASLSKQLSNLGFGGDSVSSQLADFQGVLGEGRDARMAMNGWIEGQTSPFASGAGGGSRVA
jgi:hypothetical protein